ncbi:MAG: exonuclease domain-containing protein [Polyangiaceae bacterium]|nr:exonuclease domain-containing protein [Polyangiaceae bacterium]
MPLRLATPAFLSVALASMMGLSTCRNSTDTPSRDTPQTSAKPKTAAPADLTLPGVDASSLTPRERREWATFVSEMPAPCPGAGASIAQCVTEKRNCAKCTPAARFLVKQVRDGHPRETVMEAYKARFDSERAKSVDLADTPQKGPSSAPVTIVEWADFECPFCKRAAPIIEGMVDRFPGKVRFLFKVYPLSMHPHAEPASKAAFAALNQDKFWEMHHKLFEKAPALENADLEKYAKELGLDVAKFKADFDSPAVAARVARDKKQGDQAGLQGTPLIFINGREFSGGGDFQNDLEEWIRLELELLGEKDVKPVPAPTLTQAASASAPAPSASAPKLPAMKLSADGCGCFPTGRHYPGIAHLMRVDTVGLADEFDPNHDWHDLPVAFLDTETTGTSAETDRIVEVGIIIGQNGTVQRRYNWLINPRMPIPPRATEVHGISDDDVKDQPSFDQVAAEIFQILHGSLPAAYNAAFDRSFLRAEMRRAGLGDLENSPPALRNGVEWVDPLVWSRHVNRQERSHKLGDVAARLGVELQNAHRASDDAEAALLVLYRLGRDERVPRRYGSLIKEQRRLGKIQEQEMARWRNR